MPNANAVQRGLPPPTLAEAMRAYGCGELDQDQLDANWQAHCDQVRQDESALLLLQNGYWLDCRDPLGASAMAANMVDLMPMVIQLAAMSDGDYCDLGEAVYNLINRRFREVAKRIHTGGHHAG